MAQLSDIGIELSMTGGIVTEDLHLFKEHKVKSFIAGRALAADNGAEIAGTFHQAIAKNWA